MSLPLPNKPLSRRRRTPPNIPPSHDPVHPGTREHVAPIILCSTQELEFYNRLVFVGFLDVAAEGEAVGCVEEGDGAVYGAGGQEC